MCLRLLVQFQSYATSVHAIFQAFSERGFILYKDWFFCVSEEMTEVLSAEAYTANLTIKDVKNWVHSQLVQKQQQWKEI